MRYYMAFDGGGTKLQGILFDEDCRLLSSARTEGVNTTVRSREQAEENVRACIRALLNRRAGRFRRLPSRFPQSLTCMRSSSAGFFPAEGV